MLPTEDPTCLVITDCSFGTSVSIIPLGNATLTADERKTIETICSQNNQSVQVLSCENHPDSFRDLLAIVRKL